MTAQLESTLLLQDRAALRRVKTAQQASSQLRLGRAAQRRVRIVLHSARLHLAVAVAHVTRGTVALQAPALSALRTRTRQQQEAKRALCVQGTQFLLLEAQH